MKSRQNGIRVNETITRFVSVEVAGKVKILLGERGLLNVFDSPYKQFSWRTVGLQGVGHASLPATVFFFLIAIRGTKARRRARAIKRSW